MNELSLNVIVGCFATVVVLMVVRGLLPHLLRPARIDAFHLSMAIVLILVQSVGRTSYWDLVRVFMGSEQFLDFAMLLGGVKANVVWNAILLWAGLHLLKLLHLLVPRQERHLFSMWSAWNYPVQLSRVLESLRRSRNR